MFCNNCGKTILDTDKFCPHCGAIIRKVVIDPNATADSLKTRGMMLLEDGEFYSALEYFSRLLSLEPENPYGFLGTKMAELRLHSIEEFKNHYKNLYADKTGSFNNAGMEFDDEKHISEMIQKYSVVNYLEPLDIRSRYWFDNSGDLLEPLRKQQAQKIRDEFTKDLTLNRMKRYADDDIKEAIDEIFAEYDKRIDEAEKGDKKTREKIKDDHKEYLKRTDKEIESLYDQAIERRQQDYLSVSDSEDSDDRDVIMVRLATLSRLAGYKDSLSLAERYNEKLVNIDRAKKRKRTIILSTVAGSIVLLVAAIALFILVIMPNIKYNRAVNYIEEGKYDDAIALIDELDGYRDSEDLLDEAYYGKGMSCLEERDYASAIEIFKELGSYNDAREKLKEAQYEQAKVLLDQDEYDTAIAYFENADDYKDAKDMILRSRYLKAGWLLEQRKYDDSMALFEQLGDYEDSAQRIKEVQTEKEKNTVTVPDVMNKSFDSVRATLDSLDLSYKTDYVEDAERNANLVIRITPEKGTKILRGDTVQLTITKGLDKYVNYSGDNNSNVLYQINITNGVKKLWIRSSPSTRGNQGVGETSAGDVFNVYESVRNEGYTWYRVGYQEWIANDGTWAVRDGKCDGKNGDFNIRDGYVYSYTDNDDTIGVYDNPNKNANKRNWVDGLAYGSNITVYFRFNDGQYWWYKIGPDRWIKDNGGDRVRIY